MVFLSLSLQVFYQLCLHQLFNSQQAFVGNDDTTLAWLKVIGLIVGLVLLTIGAIYVLEAKRKILSNMLKTVCTKIITSNLSTFKS